MPDLPLAVWKQVCEAATPGPWEQRQGDSTKENLVADVRGLTIYGPYKAVSCGDDATFIATFSPSVVLQLLKVVAQQQEALEAIDDEED